MPIRGLGIPKVEDMDLIVSFIKYHTSKGKREVCMGNLKTSIKIKNNAFKNY